eukprot:33511_1
MSQPLNKKRKLNPLRTDRNKSKKMEDVNMRLLKWNDIAVTSLSTVFEYINIKHLYSNASRVCKYWHSTVCGTHSSFIFGYYRKSMHQNPCKSLTLKELQTFNVRYIKQELKARNMRLNGRKSELIKRVHAAIRKDGLLANINNEQSIKNRKRLILFAMQQFFDNNLFCDNCHTNWSTYWQTNKKSLSKKDIVKRLPSIHHGLKICIRCANQKEYTDVNGEHALKYYGLNQNDFIKCGIVFKHGKGQMVNMIAAFNDHYTNAYVALQIAKMKYGNEFERRTIQQEKELAMKARGLLQKGMRQEYIQIYAPNVEYTVDDNRFQFDELLYNARL